MAFVRPKLEHVARNDGALACHGGLSVLDRRHTSDEHAAVVRTAVAHDLVSAFALQVCGSEATGERLGKLGVLLLRSSRSGPILRTAFARGVARHENAVERGAISAGYSIDIFGRLHAAFDFQGRHTGAYQIRKQVDAAQILRGQQVVARCRERLALRHVMQCVRQAARLRAQAAIGRAPADERGHEALARIAHTQRTVGERLDFQAQLIADLRQMLDLGQRQLARERHARCPELGSGLHTRLVVRVHLRGDMQARLRQRSRKLGGDADILHDERIGAGAICLARRFHGAVDLAGQNGRVERNVDIHAAQMRESASIGERVDGEIVGATSRVERLKAQVNRVGATTHSGMEGSDAASRRQKLHFLIHISNPH